MFCAARRRNTEPFIHTWPYCPHKLPPSPAESQSSLALGFPSSCFLLQKCPSFWQTCMDSVRSICDTGSKDVQLGSPILHQIPGHPHTLPPMPRHLQKRHPLQAKRPFCFCGDGCSSLVKARQAFYYRAMPAFHWGILGKMVLPTASYMAHVGLGMSDYRTSK